jgi:hypothetical protein
MISLSKNDLAKDGEKEDTKWHIQHEDVIIPQVRSGMMCQIQL